MPDDRDANAAWLQSHRLLKAAWAKHPCLMSLGAELNLHRMTELPATSIPGIYAALMEEVKERRDAAVERLAAAHHTDPPYSYLEVEFCYLQIRRICEALAMAVLVAHNEIGSFRSQRLMKAWNADALIRELTSLSPAAFPRAAEIFRDPDPRAFSAKLAGEGFLVKEDLTRIYHKCSERLHGGSLKRMLDHGPQRYSVNEVASWFHEIVRLLNVHVVMLPAGKMMTVEMTGGEGGSVICHLDVLET